jgi:hypothetical protein
MPTEPLWFHRIDRIRDDLLRLDCEYLDRQAVEKVFGVGERRARQLMNALPCIRIGNAAAVRRLDLLNDLTRVRGSGRVERELGRRARVAGLIEDLRRSAAARNVMIPVISPPEAGPLAFSAGIELGGGRLQVSYSSAEDLASKLFELSQVMAADWLAFKSAIE